MGLTSSANKRQLKLERMILHYFLHFGFDRDKYLDDLESIPPDGVSKTHKYGWDRLLGDDYQPGMALHDLISGSEESKQYDSEEFSLLGGGESIVECIEGLRSVIRCRELLKTLGECLDEKSLTDPDKTLDSISEACENLKRTESSSHWVDLATITESDAYFTPAATTPTCIDILDLRLDGGFPLSDASVIGGRPGDGKSALAASIAVHRAFSGLKTGFVNWEMSNQLQAKRMISIALQVDGSKVRHNPQDHIDPREYKKNIFLLEDTTSNPKFIERQIKNHHNKHPDCMLYFVDYIQYAVDHEKSKQVRNYFLEKVTKDLQNLAKALGISICMLAQLNRDSEDKTKSKSGNMRPRMSGLKDCGGLEQNCSTIVLIWDRWVGVINDPATGILRSMGGGNEPQNATRDKTLVVDKCRYGAPGVVDVCWTPQHTRFEPFNLHTMNSMKGGIDEAHVW